MCNKGTHLNFSDRQIIEKGISNGSSKSTITSILDKNKSAIGKEIKLHRTLKHKCRMPLECNNYPKCIHGRNCISSCEHYSPFSCIRRDRSPGACNGCASYTTCRFDKYYYNAFDAQDIYRTSLIDAREGVNLTTQAAIALGSFIKPLINQGQSPYQIITNHPELNICEKTLYNYISSGVFRCVGILDIDLRVKPRRKMSKEKRNAFKKRKDRRYIQGRTYDDYLSYIAEHPEATVVQMDTVYNDVSNGPFLQTFKFISYGFLIGFIHDTKTAQNMIDGVLLLESILGNELFNRCVEVLLTDRGSEFTGADEIEQREDGSRRTRLFYCNPMQSGQKGSLENNHRELRYICLNEVDLRKLGLKNQNQKDMNLVISHINSSPKELLRNKTPFETIRFFNEPLYNQLKAFGLEEIEIK